MARWAWSNQGSLFVWALVSIFLIIIHFLVAILTTPSTGSVISLLVGSDLVPPLLSKVSLWLLYFFGFYQTFRQIGEDRQTEYWPRLETFFADRTTAAMIAGFAITTALVVSTFVLNMSRIGTVKSTGEPSTLILLLGLMAVGTILCSVILYNYRKSESDQSLVVPAFRRMLSDQKFQQTWRENSRLAATFRSLIYLNEAAAVASTTIFLGIAIALVWLFYPIPELVILASSGYILTKHSFARDEQLSKQIVDPESPFVDTALAIISSSKGFNTAPLLITGLFLSSVPFVISAEAIRSSGHSRLALSALPTANASGLPPIAYTLIRVEYLLGFLASGVLGYWYWFRVGKRLPAFLTAWENTEIERILQGTEDETELDETEVKVRRPETNTILSSGLAVIAASYPLFRRTYDPVLIDIGFIITFLIVLGMAVFVLWKTVTSKPQAALTDKDAIPEAFAIQVFFTAYLVVVINPELFFSTFFGALIMLPLFLGAYYSPDISRLAEEADDWRQYSRLLTDLAKSGWLVLCGLFIIIMPFLSSWVAVPLVLIGGSCSVYFLATFALTRRL